MSLSSSESENVAQRHNQAADIQIPGMGFAEFITLMAWLMALPALTIDMMLPALPAIAEHFQLEADNQRQLMITIYMLGFAFGQLIFGPISDRYGRRPVLFAGLLCYLLATAVVLLAPNYFWILSARALQGFAAAAPRILAVAIVRDCSVGRAMSRIMSFIMMVFVIVPILAPLGGAGLLHLGSWHGIFWFMELNALVALVWVAWRLPETRRAEYRSSLHPRALWQTLGLVMRERQTVGYGLGIGFVFGCVLTYVASSQQIFGETYGLGEGFALAFGGVGLIMASASITNIRLVRRIGMRRMSHTGLVGFALVGLIYLLAGFPAHPPFWVFYLFLVASFYPLCLTMPNFNALAMEPMGAHAGLGSALLGCYTTIAGAALGWLFGQAYDGTVRPLVLGFLLMGVAALLSTLWTERGRLWQAHDEH